MMQKFSAHTARLAVLAAATALALAACGGKEGGQAAAGQKQGGAQQQQAPSPVVEVVTVEPQDVALSVELPGRLEAQNLV